MADALKTLRFGIVGCGLRGRLYGQILKRLHGVEVAALFDVSAPTAGSLSAELGAPVAASLADLMARDLDAVIVATPDFAHVEPVLAATERKLHIFLEKPVATSSQDARVIRDAVLGAGVLCTVACMNRWHPVFANLLARVRAGEFGAVVSQNVRLSNSLHVPLNMLKWAGDSSPGWFLMPHSLDLVGAAVGVQPARVYAAGRRGLLARSGVDTWDSLQATIRFADGGTANAESVWVLPEGSPSLVDFRYELVGEKGVARVDDRDQGLEIVSDRLALPRVQVQEIDGRIAGPNLLMIESFVQSVRDGVQKGPDVTHSAWITELIEAIHLSAAEDRPVDVGGAA
jgi:predicted dehydrogenase